MTSSDIEPLFTNIPLEKTINTCTDKLFQNKPKIINLTKESFPALLIVAILNSS